MLYFTHKNKFREENMGVEKWAKKRHTIHLWLCSYLSQCVAYMQLCAVKTNVFQKVMLCSQAKKSMMEASSFSETMVPIYCPKQCHIFLTPSII
jgi:hypothetical protein